MRQVRWACLALLLILGAASSARAGSTIKSDEKVILFTTAASRQGDTWVAPIHGWIFEPEEDSLWRGALVESLRAALEVKGSQERIFRKRMAWFLVDNESRKKLTVEIGGVKGKMGKSSSGGHFTGSVRIPGHGQRDSLSVVAQTRKGDPRRFAGTVLLVPEEGISVISDVDDTIKVTSSWDKERTLKNTFLFSFQAVPDMASLYRRWHKEGAVFHYVSAGPWQLYEPLTSFMSRVAFPLGTLHLQNFRLKDDSRFNLLDSPRRYKLTEIEALLTQFPKRSFVLVGDAGQEDPEIYAEVARAHPGQIRAIYIRLIGPRGMPESRLQAVQKGLRIPVQVFEKPTELKL